MLGLFDGPQGGAALFRSGRCICVAYEDRMMRRAGAPGMPRAAVQTVLAETGIGGTQIDLVVVATRDATHTDPCGGESPGTALC
ncbi:hypothetical protein K8I85_00055, partial [bacterium]|nr:hypothetical protein [bacterium]